MVGCLFNKHFHWFVFFRSGSIQFEKIKTVRDWWGWTQSSLLDTLYWDTWYNGQATDYHLVSPRAHHLMTDTLSPKWGLVMRFNTAWLYEHFCTQLKLLHWDTHICTPPATKSACMILDKLLIYTLWPVSHNLDCPGFRDLTFFIIAGRWVESRGVYENCVRYGGVYEMFCTSKGGVYKK